MKDWQVFLCPTLRTGSIAMVSANLLLTEVCSLSAKNNNERRQYVPPLRPPRLFSVIDMCVIAWRFRPSLVLAALSPPPPPSCL